MKLFSMSCTIYSNVVVAETRYCIHLYTNRLNYLLPRCVMVALIGGGSYWAGPAHFWALNQT